VGVWLFDQHTQGQAVQPIPYPARHGSNGRVGRSCVASRIRAAWLAGTTAPPHSPERRSWITLRVRRPGQTARASVTTVGTSVHACNGLSMATSARQSGLHRGPKDRTVPWKAEGSYNVPSDGRRANNRFSPVSGRPSLRSHTSAERRFRSFAAPLWNHQALP
jgi:hypothetical protein